MNSKKLLALLIAAVLLLALLSGCAASKAEPEARAQESMEPAETPEATPTAVTEEEQLFLSSLLAALCGQDFADVSNLTNEAIASILLSVPDIEFAVSSPAKAFLNYHEETDASGGTYYMVADQDLENASEAIFGREVSVSGVKALENIASYYFSGSACGQAIGVGHGANYAIDIADIQYDGDRIEVSYSKYSTNPYEPDAVPTDTVNYTAVFERTAEASRFPFRILSNLRQDDTRSAEVIAVEKAYEQLMDYAMLQKGSDGSMIVMELTECSFLRGYTADDFYFPVADCYLLNLDSDAEPELIVECGQAETASYLLDYRQGGFDVTMAQGHPIQKTDGDYYTVVAIPGGMDEGQLLYRIDPNTLEAKLAEEQYYSRGNYVYWAESEEYHALTPVQKNEWRFFLLEDAVKAYYH